MIPTHQGTLLYFDTHASGHAALLLYPHIKAHCSTLKPTRQGTLLYFSTHTSGQADLPNPTCAQPKFLNTAGGTSTCSRGDWYLHKHSPTAQGCEISFCPLMTVPSSSSAPSLIRSCSWDQWHSFGPPLCSPALSDPALCGLGLSDPAPCCICTYNQLQVACEASLHSHQSVGPC